MPSNAGALLDAAPEQVQSALGAPDLRRRDGTAQVWLYAPSPQCRVDVVFYADVGPARVAHAAARLADGMREDACLTLVAARSPT